jgi:hypothetical protein
MAQSRTPDFFIVGAPKSGTTSLYDYLSGHPDIYMSPVKEPFYFCPDVLGGAPRRFSHPADEASYLALFDGAGRARRAGEASTRYLVSRVAAELIRDFNPAARAIAMLRNPIDMIYALHGERVSLGLEPIENFSDALDADVDRRAGRRLPAGANPLGAVYRDTGMYSQQIERWFDALGRDRVLIVVFDDFAVNPARELERVLSFLGVDSSYQPSSLSAVNRSHRLRRGVVRSALRSPPAQWTAHRLLPAVIGQNSTSRLARRFRLSRVNRRPYDREPLPAGIRRELENDFESDVRSLSGLLNRDLGALWLGRPSLDASGLPVSSTR